MFLFPPPVGNTEIFLLLDRKLRKKKLHQQSHILPVKEAKVLFYPSPVLLQDTSTLGSERHWKGEHNMREKKTDIREFVYL